MYPATPKSVGLNRLKKILINDKHFDPARLNALLASDCFSMLENYFELSKEDVAAQISFDSAGGYIIRIKARSNRVKVMGILPEVL